ncbi:hypothetical protein PVAP13_2NG029615 [Panicum virgatum]|uniref:Uncharacterized protein n=1 Tax=Panicum virgatum TaxID=38727 RepID=A0A8T0VAU7_PANVG|nr:hypothetical protein PVAP13_2NG021283 [Panicum virgatum]KAG2631497.1 hypothetical protein PVAP13_2NG029615 [Panicum virgatum]
MTVKLSARIAGIGRRISIGLEPSRLSTPPPCAHSLVGFLPQRVREGALPQQPPDAEGGTDAQPRAASFPSPAFPAAPPSTASSPSRAVRPVPAQPSKIWRVREIPSLAPSLEIMGKHQSRCNIVFLLQQHRLLPVLPPRCAQPPRHRRGRRHARPDARRTRRRGRAGARALALL